MSIFSNKYPYTDFHELNLDWILSKVRENEERIKNFINLNTIKYSDPIAWDITSQYEANTVVIDNQTGNAYISTKAVPSGVHISDVSYWTQIYNYANELETLRLQIAHSDKDSTTASAPRAIGDLVFVRGVLLRITSQMIAGDSYVIGSNCVETTIEAEIHSMIENINNEVNARTEADLTLTQALNNEVETRAEGDAELETRIEEESNTRAQADAELASQIGNVNDYSIFRNKKVLIIGDSISDEEHFPNCWVKFFRENCESMNTVIDTFAINGEALASTNVSHGIAEQYASAPIKAYTYDYVLVEVGINDWGATIPIGNFGSDTYTTFYGAMKKLRETLLNRNPQCAIFWITPPKTFLDPSITGARPLVCNLYRANMLQFASANNMFIIDLTTGIKNYNPSMTLDNLHPNAETASLIADIVANKVSNPVSDMGDIWNYFTFTPSANFNGNIEVRVNCHGLVIFRIIANVEGSLTANQLYPLTDDTNIVSYLGTSILFDTIDHQIGGVDNLGFISASNKLYVMSTVGGGGRIIGDKYITALLASPIQS